ncbi:peptide chain release factor N(5)-glutamine methyltransferase [Lacinutrix iliipiscaria]|uniref:Release factor glutamine methyltransferase n=1 Tax=Lacinutrix iliipiscaria TaxID=1230532 RepID=A0ABW5WRF9_9FLAO
MKLKVIQDIFHKELDPIYGANEVNSMFYLLIDAFYGFSRLQLVLDSDYAIIKEEQERIIDALDRLKREEPIQYILKETEFYGLIIKVNTQTLIPRPETEELVQWIIDEVTLNTTKKPLTILDVGTGSGCIAIALAKHLPQAQVYAIDVSEAALKVAKDNSKLNNVKIEFIKGNVLDVESCPLPEDVRFDIIVSNPPYVRQLEKEKMRANVLEHEPHLALFVKNENPLEFYEAITKLAVNNLKPKGLLFFEINEYFGKEMIDLLDVNKFQSIELKQDIFSKDRMIKGTKG